MAFTFPVIVNEPAAGVTRTLVNVASEPPKEQSTVEFAAQSEFVTTIVDVAAVKATRPRPVFDVAFPGVPELSR